MKRLLKWKELLILRFGHVMWNLQVTRKLLKPNFQFAHSKNDVVIDLMSLLRRITTPLFNMH